MDKFYSHTQLLKPYPKPLVPSIFPSVIDNTPMLSSTITQPCSLSQPIPDIKPAIERCLHCDREELKENELVVPFEVDREELEEPMNKTSKEVKVSEIDCQTSAFQVEELVGEEKIPVGEQNVDEVAKRELGNKFEFLGEDLFSLFYGSILQDLGDVKLNIKLVVKEYFGIPKGRFHRQNVPYVRNKQLLSSTLLPDTSFGIWCIKRKKKSVYTCGVATEMYGAIWTLQKLSNEDKLFSFKF
ncbi:hypothetical protein FNV43_RR19587 [Rhamnella rubrinervis]|uniref:Uncharacterized protein n=1 Tax=Rhamnella rubrinervis TaxID=2594499 RepID=A0A8K0DZI1_9ROSA|nr:hypothetical protein FNV43_RR19587 [Rhamnella rubrinervis]